MGVLEARENAEKVGYPIVGEEIKDADNIIDYDIREEQTKDISAEINANNQTTTGMANVIPGVNAPKLIESTSIISTPRPGYIYAKIAFYGSPMSDGDVQTVPIYYITDKLGTPNFTVVNSTRLKFPADGIYQLYIMFPAGVTKYYWKTEVRTNKQGFIATDTSTTTGNNHELTKSWSFKKGEILTVDCTMFASGWTGTASPYILMTATRLG